VDARDHTVCLGAAPRQVIRPGYAPDVLRRALSLVVAALPPESRERAVGEMMRALEELHAREGVALDGAASAPLELILAELRQHAAETSWRQVGREVGLNPGTVRRIAEHGTRPRRSTETRLRRWGCSRVRGG
jgi:hypothetical protein